MPESAAATFVELCRPVSRGGETFAAIPSGWAQGRATFGGLLVGMAIAAARDRLPERRACRGLVASFPSPLAAGDVEVVVHTLRHGRAVSHFQVDLRQAGEVGCLAIASFGAPRPSTVAVTPPPRPSLPPPEALPTLANPTYGAPEFTQFVDYRLGFGDRPYTGSTAREIGGWCRIRDDAGPVGEEHVAALVDAWPSAAVSRLAGPAPAASITWALDLLPIEPDVDPAGWWLYHSELEAAADGYAHASARLWSPAGRLAALSRQVVAIFG
jgi:acyl-CoA thioesterase